MRPTDPPDTIELALDKTAVPDDGRSDPLFAFASLPVSGDDEAETVGRLDPARIDFDEQPAPARRRQTRGPIGSLILHLLPFLTLLAWPRTPIETPAPIPVQLVIEQPPPPPQPAEPKPAAKPPPGRLSSDDFAEAAGPKTKKGAGDASPSAGAPQPPAAEAEAAHAEPPKPAPPAEQSNEEPRPPPSETQIAEIPPPKPTSPPPKPKPPKVQAVMRMPQSLGDSWPLPLEPNEAKRTAARVGPNATRDEYCAYALQLALRHLDLLPNSLIGARRGATLLSIRVLEDGTIQNVMVAHSSGYSDIDERVEMMIRAVGRFPPLPRWVPGRWMDFTFQLHFPHEMEH